MDATEEHDDDAHQRVETPINIVSQYLAILVSQIMCSGKLLK